ncbi:hypothetical protein [Glaciihabitans sp. dw_435]|uniref:hypothetical protein n=1 Tax=Glaciihabitans sp. dw_435 TaxID=2720081 RepID=UPI001BD2612F|nr:hypothetical protein [Glaciihabitans sp. dw_435]
MTDVLYAVVVYAAIFLVAGVPLALCLRNTGGVDDARVIVRGAWSTLLIDALLYGLVLTTLGVVFSTWIGPIGVAAVVALWVGALVAAILRVRRAGLPPLWRPRARQWWLTAAWAVVLIGSLLLRLRQSNFLPWVGDMGAYVNWANEFVRTGTLQATWPPFFSSYLAIGSSLFGPGLTAAAVPLGGILLVLVIARVLRQMDVGPWATLTTAALVGLSVHAIWYSSFPASEALNAPLYIGWVSTIIGVLRSDRARLPWWLAVNGILMMSLGLLRGTGPLLLVPLIIVGVIVVIFRDWRTVSVRIWLAISASLFGALVSYWYGIQRIPHYYVQTQIADLLPGSVFRVLDKIGLFAPSVLTALIVLVASAVLCGAGLWLARRGERGAGASRAPFILGLVLGGGLIVGMGVTLVLNLEVLHVLLRAGAWLTIIAFLLVLLVGWLKLPPYLSALVLTFGVTAVIFLTLQTFRLKGARGHSFFLYWDRYIFSELIPLFFVMFGLAIGVAWTLWLGRRASALRTSQRPLFRAVPAVLVVVLLAVAIVPSIGQVRLATKHAYFDGAYEFEQSLIAMVPDDSTPVLWAATKNGQVPGFFFPNTWMAFAKPMARSFGYNVLNIATRVNDFAPDEVMTSAQLLSEAACASTDELVVFETDLGGPALDARVSAPGLTITPLGESTSALQLLSQPPTNGDWVTLAITVRGYSVQVDPAVRAATACTPTPVQ